MNMKNKIATILFLIASLSMSYAQNKDEQSILKTLDNQIEYWNKGNIEQFMVGYLASDSLMFIGSKGMTMGYQKTLENYKKGYPDRAAMGTLKFDILRLKPMGKKHYFVIGKWHLTRPEKGDVGGHFSLVFEKIKGVWVIIADHSS
jgi:hypothetical protein